MHTLFWNLSERQYKNAIPLCTSHHDLLKLWIILAAPAKDSFPLEAPVLSSSQWIQGSQSSQVVNFGSSTPLSWLFFGDMSVTVGRAELKRNWKETSAVVGFTKHLKTLHSKWKRKTIKPFNSGFACLGRSIIKHSKQGLCCLENNDFQGRWKFWGKRSMAGGGGEKPALCQLSRCCFHV